jgi:3-deoxy-D-manno-octulosonate 8-phosphate phosphatase KdsC-like HAD superfamily phosphatase
MNVTLQAEKLLYHFIKKYGNIKLIVFDFDETITALHTGGSFYFKDNKIEQIMALMNDVTFFKQFVNLLEKNKINVAIATYADEYMSKNINVLAGQKMVLKFMDIIFGNDYNPFNINNVIAFHPVNKSQIFVNICNELDMEQYNKIKHEKNIHLSLLQKKYNLDKNEILLIDNDKRNTDAATKYGFCGYHVPDGFSIELTNNI